MAFRDPERQRAYQREWHKQHPEEGKEAQRKYREKNREHRREASRKWREANGMRWAMLQWRYDITRERWDEMLVAQGGVCAAEGCGAKPTDVDHDHACCGNARNERTCGKCVRGLLCSSHNRRDALNGDSG